MRTNKSIFQLFTAVLVVTALVSACGPAATAAPTAVPAVPTTAPAAQVPAATAAPSSMDTLVAAAQKEGSLTTIALPHDWCNYGGTIDAFKAKYGIQVNELAPDGTSADELEAVKANKGSNGPQAPDVLDIGFAFGPQAQADGLLMPYQSIHLGQHSSGNQGLEWLLVRGLLWGNRFHRQHRRATERAPGLV